MIYIPLQKTEAIENHGQILACNYSHTVFPNGIAAISNSGIEPINGRDWEIFNVTHETKDAYYGMPMEGMGLMNCRILKSDTRPFTENELAVLSGKTIGIYGSHTDKFSGQSYAISINPIKEKRK